MKLPLFVGTGVADVPFGGNASLAAAVTNYWKCDTDGTFIDFEGGRNGTINGATFTASGKINGAYDYDGVNDNVTLGVTAIITSINFSVSLWVNPDVVNSDDFIFNVSDGTTYHIFLEVFNNDLILGGHDGTSFKTITTPVSAVMQNVMITSNGTQLELFINNVSKGTIAFTSNGVQNADFNNNVWGSRWFMGAGSLCFDGVIDEMGLFNGTTFTSQNRTDLYNGGAGLQY